MRSRARSVGRRRIRASASSSGSPAAATKTCPRSQNTLLCIEAMSRATASAPPSVPPRAAAILRSSASLPPAIRGRNLSGHLARHGFRRGHLRNSGFRLSITNSCAALFVATTPLRLSMRGALTKRLSNNQSVARRLPLKRFPERTCPTASCPEKDAGRDRLPVQQSTRPSHRRILSCIEFETE